jgi:radical SAM superfamily enzyme YgiQ (UPF0313 family)
MTPILLTTLNARYHHCAFGLRYLYANLQELQAQAKIVEFTISQNPRDIVEMILAENPTIVGFGVYIWNTRQTHEVVSILKRVRPDIKIVLGGPEVSYEAEGQAIVQLADLTIKGEADFIFYEVCRDYFTQQKWPSQKVVAGVLPAILDLALPYIYYSDIDIQNRVIYVEASRGCPYKCEYCLSSLDKSVRSFDLDLFLGEMNRLIERGARSFKFIDRTFNLSIPISSKILQFFLDRIDLGLFLHFEMVPDRLPVELRDLIARFPRGSLQFEIGIQTWNTEVSKLVSRRQDYAKIRENFAYLAEIGTVHTHADLIAGLPSETIESFARGFDAVAELNADEIQVGILKRLKGTPIIRHDAEWQMVYSEHPPFQVLQTRTMNYETLQRIVRFSHFWDLIANSGNFKNTMKFLLELSRARAEPSLFWEFDELSRFLNRRHSQGHSVALLNLVESVWNYLKSHPAVDTESARAALTQDYAGSQMKRSVPQFLKAELVSEALKKKIPAKEAWSEKVIERGVKTVAMVSPPVRKTSATPARQRRHLSEELKSEI